MTVCKLHVNNIFAFIIPYSFRVHDSANLLLVLSNGNINNQVVKYHANVLKNHQNYAIV